MRRRAKPAKAEVEVKAPGVSKSRRSERSAVGDLEKRLAEAQEQQTATAEILRVIASSPTDTQPVFDVIARNAVALCDGFFSVVGVSDGRLVHLRASHNLPEEWANQARAVYPLPLSSKVGTATVIREQRLRHVLDAQKDGVDDGSRQRARTAGYRTWLGVPLLGSRGAIGVLAVARREKAAFTDSEIALLKTFADQAVIAIENVRLFTETKEALEQQTATSEILRVISSSPTDTQPVFDTIAANAARLCAARDAQVLRVEGDVLRLVSAYGSPSMPPVRTISRGHAVGRAIIDRQTIHVRDMAHAVADFPETSSPLHGVESLLAVPLLHEDVAVGVIRVSRTQIQPFTESQIALLKTFADQAVIAIENVRLFNETKEALEQQTATSEILRVISSSPTDIQPVLDALVESAARLCRSVECSIFLLDGDRLALRARYGPPPATPAEVVGEFALPIVRGTVGGRTVLERRTIHVVDLLGEADEFPQAQQNPHRTILSVPLIREGAALGVIQLRRTEVNPFTDRQADLLKTFADQAVIAIENVRLFKELEASNKDLREALDTQTATSDILRVISKSPTDLQPVFDPLLDSAVRLCGATHASLYRLDGDGLHHVAARGSIQGPRPVGVKGPIPHGTAPGRAILTGETVQVMDAQEEVAGMPPDAGEYVRREGVRTVLAVPLLREGSSIGVLVVRRTEVRPFSESEMRLLITFADQAVIAIENVRLFKELEVANHELAAASQHKSEFLANMSHELRTPLNAIIGFSEVLTDRMFGELNEKQEEYLKDIYASGTHLLSLINDILDLSKIEAGRMELELTDFDLPVALDNAMTLVRERAGRRSIALHTNIDKRLGVIQGDERKIRQVVLNLLSNAIKFTPEGGRIELAAVPRDGCVEVSVSDTGVGIAPEDQEKVFEEFRQVGTADKKAEGTGLGLTLCRKFIELHGGKIWVKSQLGGGATFTFTIPVHRGE